MQVAPAPLTIHNLAQQQRPPVTEPRRVAAELVPGVDLRDGRRTVRHRVPRELVNPQLHAELQSQRLVVDEQPRLRRPHRLPRDKQAFE